MRWIKKLARWTFVIAADLSLLLCVCSVMAWVRSYFVEDMLDLRETFWVTRAGSLKGHSRQTIAEYGVGEFRVGMQDSISSFPWSANIPAREGDREFFLHQTSPPMPSRGMPGSRYILNRWGFRMARGSQSMMQSGTATSEIQWWGVSGPMWSLVVVFGLLPGARLVIWMRRKPRRDGRFCEKCGYDLRESKERCPECGLVVESVGTS
jgi:hypothetical protein